MNTTMPTVIAFFVATFFIFSALGINIDYVGESETNMKADGSPEAKSDVKPDVAPDGSKTPRPKKIAYSPAALAALARDAFRIAKEKVAAQLGLDKVTKVAPSRQKASPGNALTELESDKSGPVDLTDPVLALEAECKQCWAHDSHDCEGNVKPGEDSCCPLPRHAERKEVMPDDETCEELGYGLGNCTCFNIVLDGHCAIVAGDSCSGKCEKEFCTKNCDASEANRPYCSASEAGLAVKKQQRKEKAARAKKTSKELLVKKALAQRRAVLTAARALLAAEPEMGIEDLVGKLDEEQPKLRATSKKVREALKALLRNKTALYTDFK